MYCKYLQRDRVLPIADKGFYLAGVCCDSGHSTPWIALFLRLTSQSGPAWSEYCVLVYTSMQSYIKGGLCNGTREKEEEEVLEDTWITVAKYEGTPILFLIWLIRDVSFTFSRNQRKPKFLQMPVKGKERRLKEHSLKGLQSLRNCYAHAPVHSPMSRFLHTQGCFVRHLYQCIRQGSAFPFILLCSFML